MAITDIGYVVINPAQPNSNATQPVQLYVPYATNALPGIASFDNSFFALDGHTVSLKKEINFGTDSIITATSFVGNLTGNVTSSGTSSFDTIKVKTITAADGQTLIAITSPLNAESVGATFNWITAKDRIYTKGIQAYNDNKIIFYDNLVTDTGKNFVGPLQGNVTGNVTSSGVSKFAEISAYDNSAITFNNTVNLPLLKTNNISSVDGDAGEITVSGDLNLGSCSITAYNFIGNVTGNVTGNLTGNVISSGNSSFNIITVTSNGYIETPTISVTDNANIRNSLIIGNSSMKTQITPTLVKTTYFDGNLVGNVTGTNLQYTNGLITNLAVQHLELHSGTGIEFESALSENAIIVTNGNGVPLDLGANSGLVIITGAGVNDAYPAEAAPLYDSSNDALVLGQGTYYGNSYSVESKRNTFEFGLNQKQLLATRSSNITNGNLLKWDNEHHVIIDSGKSISDYVPNSRTIAGIDLQNNITAQDLTDALIYMNTTTDVDYVMED